MIPNPELNIWEHSAQVRKLYAERASGETPEMDAAIQAAEILGPLLNPGQTLLDAGCGSGYYYWTFKNRGIDIEYHGIDYSPTLIDIGRRHLPAEARADRRLQVAAIEDLDDVYDAVLCFNTLSWCADFRLPLDRLCAATRRVILIRTNLGPTTEIRWEEDGYLDEGYNHLKAYWNRWSEMEMIAFMMEQGFSVRPIVDLRTGGEVEMVVGKPYTWKLLLGVREEAE